MGKLKNKVQDNEIGPATDSVERIIIKREEADKLERWLTQLNDKYDGLVKFSKSEIACFLIRHHDDDLSETQINLLGAELYDELRWLNRAVEKVRQAKRCGLTLSLEDLMIKRKPIEKIKASLLKRDRNQRKPSANEEHPSEDQVEFIANKNYEG